jgi:hypothetical protein
MIAFSKGNLLYNDSVRLIVFDKQILPIIKQQMMNLSEMVTEIYGNDIKKIKTVNPFGFLPNDMEVYNDRIFASDDDGLFSCPRPGVNNVTNKRKTVKHSDARIFGIKPSEKYSTIAAAAGDDGILEFKYKKSKTNVEVNLHKQTDYASCTSCDWMFQSVIGWSQSNSFMASYSNNSDNDNEDRFFDGVIYGDDLFECVENPKKHKKPDQIRLQPSINNHFIWGCKEKIYMINDDKIRIKNYDHEFMSIKKGTISKKRMFSTVADAQLLQFKRSDITSTGTAPFGTIIELDDKIIVLRSDDKVDIFYGEAVSWRVFPRSRYFSNQLHIVYEDRIEIISFTHDYFVNQGGKLYGFSKGNNNFYGNEE